MQLLTQSAWNASWFVIGCYFFAGAHTDFFDQFEQQTGGENFNREDASATQKRGNSSPAADAKAAEPSEATAAAASKEEEEDDKETLTDFFDEFEKTTLGEDFRREGTT